MSSDNQIKQLNITTYIGPEYKGQIYRTLQISTEQPSAPDFPENFKKIFAKHKINTESYLPHVADVLSSIFINDKNTAFFSPPFTNRAVTAIMASILNSDMKNGNTIILCPNQQYLKIFDEILAKDFKYTELKWKIIRTDTESISDETDPNALFTELIITDISTFYSIIKKGKDDLLNWLNNLRLIVFYDLAENVIFYQIKLIFSFLWVRIPTNLAPKILYFGPPIANKDQLLKWLFGSEFKFEIFSNYLMHATNYRLNLWVPAFTVDTAHKKITRNSIAIELEYLLKLLVNVSSQKDSQILLWYAQEKLPIDLIYHICEKIPGIEKIRNLKIINHLSELALDDYKSFDFVILLGFPQYYSKIKDTLGSLLKNGGESFIVLLEDPRDFYIAKSIISNEPLDDPIVLLPEYSENLIELFVQDIASTLDYELIPYEKIRKLKQFWFSFTSNVPSEGKQSLIQDNIFSNLFYKEDPNIQNSVLLSLTDRIISVYDSYSQKFYILDKFLEPEIVYDGAIFKAKNSFFKLTYTQDNKMELSTWTPSSAIRSVPIIEASYENADILKKINIKPGNQSNISIVIEQKQINDLTLNLLGKLDYSDIDSAPQQIDLMGNKKEFKKTANCITIRINNLKSKDSEIILNTLLEFLRVFMSIKFVNWNELFFLQLIKDKKEICIYTYPHISFALRQLWEILTNFRNIFVFIYDLGVEKCPCVTGCNRCVISIDAPHLEKINKVKLIGILSKFSNNSGELEQRLSFKEKGINNKDVCLRYYEQLREWIFKLFENKLNLTIEAKAPMVVEKLEGSVIGLYCGNNLVKIVPSLREDLALEVIAHEYAHNWEFDPGASKMNSKLLEKDIPLDGKLYLEGFAQWVAFKSLDFYGLSSRMATDIAFRSIDAPSDEYGDGFTILNFLENIVGFNGVLQFIKEGEVKAPNGEIITSEVLLKKSGFWDKYIQTRNEREKG